MKVERRRCQTGASSGFRLIAAAAKCLLPYDGWVAEWLKAPVLKTGEPARVPWVRIPPHPPESLRKPGFTEKKTGTLSRLSWCDLLQVAGAGCFSWQALVMLSGNRHVGRRRDRQSLSDVGSIMTKERLLAALDKPRSTNAVLTVVNPGGSSVDTVQTLLMQMRDEGLVKFDIKKGLWSRA